jgi:hypothetical protein
MQCEALERARTWAPGTRSGWRPQGISATAAIAAHMARDSASETRHRHGPFEAGSSGCTAPPDVRSGGSGLALLTLVAWSGCGHDDLSVAAFRALVGPSAAAFARRRDVRADAADSEERNDPKAAARACSSHPVRCLRSARSRASGSCAARCAARFGCLRGACPYIPRSASRSTWLRRPAPPACATRS